MDIKSLKDKILQLAIQGKLVPQDENDEPASILLEKIKAEKEQLIKDKVIKKEKPLPEISEEEKLFEVPNSWEWCKLGDISNIIMGQSPDSSTVSDVKGGVEFHQGKASFGKIFINKSGLYCTNPTKIALPNDILLSVRAPVGTLNITDRELCIGRGLAAIRKYIDIENKFFYYFIMALEEELVKKSTGTTFKAVASTSIKNFLIPLPPLEEQKRIVAKVDELFELIDELDNNKQELLENISNTRNKVLQLAIQGKLVEQCEDDEPASVLLERIKEEKEQLIKDKVIKKEKPLPDISEEEKLFKTPSSWEWCRLGNISNIVMGQSPDSSTVSDVEGGIEFHQGKASFGKVFINNSGLYCTKPSKIAIPDDILLSVRAPVGTLNITDRELCIGRGLVAIRKYIDIENKFFYYFIMALEEELVKKSTGTTFKAVASTAIKEFLIPLPPLEEQNRIVAKIDLIMDYLDKLQQEIESQEIILKDILQ